MDHGGSLSSRAVIVATGGFQRPRVPGFALRLAPNVLLLDAASYRNPEQIGGGSVLVVGDGATGRQIALELAPRHKVMLATGRRRNFSFQRTDRDIGRALGRPAAASANASADDKPALGCLHHCETFDRRAFWRFEPMLL